MVKVVQLSEYFCPKCTKCNHCNKNSARIDSKYGVLRCEKCENRVVSKSHGAMGRLNVKKQLEYFATPFWKIMGLPPNEREKKEEAIRRSKGYSHLEMQKERMVQQKRVYDSTALKEKLYKRELPSGPQFGSYEKRRI